MTSPALPYDWRVTVEVDWAADGAFDGPHDDVTRDTAADPGVSIDTGRDGGRSLNPPKVPALDFELRNDHRRYSHESPSSPVYQLVSPGTPIRVSADYGHADVYRGGSAYREHDPYRGVAHWVIATARIDDIQQATPYGDQRVRIAGLGASSTLVGRPVTIPLQQDIRTDQAVALVLDAAGWPSDKRSIALGDSLLLWYWADERSAWELLTELVATEGSGACLYEDNDGVLHFEGRNYRAVTDRCQTPQSVWFDIGQVPSGPYREHDGYRAHDTYRGGTSSLYFQSLEYEPGWASLYARATYPVKRRALGALGQVWSAGGDITLAAGQSVTLFARPTDPFRNAVAPAVGTDYTVASGAATVALTYSSGFLAVLVLTAGGGGALVRGPTGSEGNGLQLRAQPLAVVSEVIAQSTISTAESASSYRGIQTLAVAGWPEVSLALAQAVCDSWVARYNVQRPSVTLRIRAGDVRHFEQVIQRQVSDRIRIRERQTGIEADAWIESRALAIGGAGGRVVAAIWRCELCDSLTGDRWGAAPTDPDGAVWDLSHWGR